MKKTAATVFSYLAIYVLLVTPAPAISQNLIPDKTVEISAVPGLKFDVTRMTAEPGSVLEIVLSNNDDMVHNLLVVTPGDRELVIQQASRLGADAAASNYTPDTPEVLAAIPVISSGAEGRITFRVPDEEGIYPYVCTIPGHGQLMYGVIYVTNNPDDLPPLAEDPNVPPDNELNLALAESPHPYPMVMPQMHRLFMPDASPASIAVGMEHGQSYVWDAGFSYLRYAWSGGYIDASEQWDRTSAEFAEIVGNIYYRNEIGFPFRTGSPGTIPEPDFKGYRMIDGYPEFIYRMGDVTVNELITPLEGGGFQIHYSLENVTSTIWYEVQQSDRERITSSDGGWDGNVLALTPDQAESFTLTIRP